MNKLCWLCLQPLKIARHGICCFCLQRLPPLPECCQRCGLVITTEQQCDYCHKTPPLWDRLIAVTDYVEPLKGLIAQYKYQKRFELAPLLARLLLLSWLAQRRDKGVNKPDIIIPVPLHKIRAWLRGFNQSALIAEQLAHWLSCEYSDSLIAKTRSTRPQQQLSLQQRKENLQSAFKAYSRVDGKEILIVDDIVTTGSTINQIAKLLRENGAKSIQVACLCRTL